MVADWLMHVCACYISACLFWCFRWCLWPTSENLASWIQWKAAMHTLTCSHQISEQPEEMATSILVGLQNGNYFEWRLMKRQFLSILGNQMPISNHFDCNGCALFVCDVFQSCLLLHNFYCDVNILLLFLACMSCRVLIFGKLLSHINDFELFFFLTFIQWRRRLLSYTTNLSVAYPRPVIIWKV